jgi:Flp pilus assembly protein TadG
LSGRATPGSVRARRDGESGQALLELALVVPILVLLVMAIFQFAFVIESQMGLTNAVREAARRTVATTTDNPTWSSLRTWTQQQLTGDGTNLGLLSQNVQAYDANQLWTAPYPGRSNTASPDVSFCSYTAAGVTNYRVRIAVEYKHPVFFGMLSFATDYVDGTNNNKWDLYASAEMRMENVDSTVVNAAGNDPGAC